MNDLQLLPERAAIFVVDVQERLSAAMPEEALAALVKNIGILGEAARQLSLPVVVSEQYPRGLGPTLPDVEEALVDVGEVHRIEKIEFSACAAEGFGPVWERLCTERDQWIVTGMETHVCVYQTVRQLRERGVSVHVASDAVTSRTDENRRIGFGLMERLGAVTTSTETVVFDLLGRAGTDAFKALSRRIR